MRSLRLFLYLVLGMLLGSYSVLSHAACQSGTAYVSSWNTFLDNSALNAAGCVYKIPEDAAIGTPMPVIPSMLTNGAGEPVAVVVLNPKQKLPIPGGWTAPTGTNIQPVPPSTATVADGYKFDTFSATVYPSGSALVSALNAAGYAPCPPPPAIGSQWSSTGDQSTFQLKECGTNVSSPGIYYVRSCPAGYTLSGSVCNLTTASAVIKPVAGKVAVVRTGNTLALDPQANPADKAPAGLTVTASDETVLLPDGSSTNLHINADGSAVLTSTIPNTDGKTSTQKKTNYSAPASDGTVGIVGKSEAQMNGTGTAATPTTAVTVSGGGSAATDVSNLATHSDVTTAATQAHSDQQTTQGKLDAIKDAMCGGTDQPACKTDFGSLDGSADTFSGALTGFKNTIMASPVISQPANFFTVTVNGGSCPVWSWAGLNGGFYHFPGFTIDQQCSSVMETIWPWIKTVLLLAASFLAFRWAFL